MSSNSPEAKRQRRVRRQTHRQKATRVGITREFGERSGMRKFARTNLSAVKNSNKSTQLRRFKIPSIPLHLLATTMPKPRINGQARRYVATGATYVTKKGEELPVYLPARIVRALENDKRRQSNVVPTKG